MQNNIRDRLIQEFTETYMEKLFYFCLKKTGSHTEAEDLTQDISLQIVSALNKGTVPTSFSSWVWQIARNRYCAWAKAKHLRNESVTGSDIGDYEIADGRGDTLDEMVHTEQLSLLRRELAFIGREYRDIVVAYYLNNKSVRDIAASLSLSQSLVKQRLFRARNILKEGMEMAREFGKLSYKPENIAFIFNGCQGENKEPWNYISRALCKNILLAAYRTPSTAEELAVEVGVALPYMEEELSSLVDATLMKKNGDKYETNFFIVSADAQEKMIAHLHGITPELTKAVIDAMEYELAWKKENCPAWIEGDQTFDDAKWAFLMSETDTTYFNVLKPYNKNASDVAGIGEWGHTIRPNGGEWDIVGMEIYYGGMPHYVSLTGCVSSPQEKDLPEIFFRQFRFPYDGIENKQAPLLTYADGQGITAVANGNYSEVEETVLERLERYGFIKKAQNGYSPAISVMRKSKIPKMPEGIKTKLEELRAKACDIATRHYLYCREQVYKEIPSFLGDDEFQIDHACANVFSIRGAVLEEAIKRGYLSLDAVHDIRTLGAYLIV